MLGIDSWELEGSSSNSRDLSLSMEVLIQCRISNQVVKVNNVKKVKAETQLKKKIVVPGFLNKIDLLNKADHQCLDQEEVVKLMKIKNIKCLDQEEFKRNEI